MQAQSRGRRDRKRVEQIKFEHDAELRGKRIEEELGLTGTEEETNAIARMQAQQRGRQDRARVERIRVEQQLTAAKIEQEVAAALGLTGSAEEDAAAARMQAIHRGRADRARVAELKGKKIEEELGLTGSADETNAIARMQAQQRGRQDRARVERIRAEQQLDAMKVEQDLAASLGLTGSAEEDAAAARMQAIQRGRVDRARVAELKGKRIEEQLGLTGSEEETAAIARMQAQQRGRQDRKRVEDLKKGQAGDTEAEAAEDPASSLGLEGTAEEDLAAAKLQAIQRGRQDRARVASMKEEGGGTAANSGGEADPAASLGLEGTAEEDAAAAKLQAIQRGRQDRARVAEMKEGTLAGSPSK